MICLFIGWFLRLALQQHRGLRHDFPDRQRLILRARQRFLIDPAAQMLAVRTMITQRRAPFLYGPIDGFGLAGVRPFRR
jgi:hypothetical protein